MEVYWRVDSFADHPDLAVGRVPVGLLHGEEVAYLATLRHEQRRREWLLGRWTAKQLVAQYLHQQGVAVPSFDQLKIAYDRAGAPLVLESSRGMARCLPISLSISHSYGHALCALVSQMNRTATSIGADIERVQNWAEESIVELCTLAELRWVQKENALGAECDLRLTALWSAKEAAMKASPAARHMPLRSIEVAIHDELESPALDWQEINVTISGETAEQAPVLLEGWWRVIESRLDRTRLVLAVLVPASTPSGALTS